MDGVQRWSRPGWMGKRWHCEHGRERWKTSCKECGGASMCEQGRERSKCKVCGGSSICEHGRVRSTCKECGGTSIIINIVLCSGTHFDLGGVS